MKNHNTAPLYKIICLLTLAFIATNAQAKKPKAADLLRQYKLASADAIVYATTLAYGADLLTCDAHFEGLLDVVFLRKA